MFLKFHEPRECHTGALRVERLSSGSAQAQTFANRFCLLQILARHLNPCSSPGIILCHPAGGGTARSSPHAAFLPPASHNWSAKPAQGTEAGSQSPLPTCDIVLSKPSTRMAVVTLAVKRVGRRFIIYEKNKPLLV